MSPFSPRRFSEYVTTRNRRQENGCFKNIEEQLFLGAIGFGPHSLRLCKYQEVEFIDDRFHVERDDRAAMRQAKLRSLS